MTAPPIHLLGDSVDLSPRVFRSGAVAASPAAAAETTVCSVTVNADVVVGFGIILLGWCAYLVGANGTTVVAQIRRTNTAGTSLKATGAQNVTAADLRSQSVIAFDTAPVLPGQVYVLDLTVANGSAASTVSAAELIAVVI